MGEDGAERANRRMHERKVETLLQRILDKLDEIYRELPSPQDSR